MESELDLGKDPRRQAKRYNNLLGTAQDVCRDLDRSVKADEDAGDILFIVNERKLRFFFDLYLSRLSSFKERMDMRGNLINDHKIAALNIVCIMDVMPIECLLGETDLDVAHTYYMNAWFAFNASINFLDIDIERVPIPLCREIAGFIKELEWISEIDRREVPVHSVSPNVDTYLRRFRYCLCLTALLAKACR